MINYIDSEKGIYLLLCDTEDMIMDLICDKEIVFLNFGFIESIKVPDYFHDNNLRRKDSALVSRSEHPNNLLACAISLLNKTDRLFIGTTGLSNESIIGILSELTLYNQIKKIIFIHFSHLNRNYKDLRLIKIDDTNINFVINYL